MRVLAAFLILFMLAGCKKDYRYTPGRAIILGNYHFQYIYYPNHDTVRYDEAVTIPATDNGYDLYIPYQGIGKGQVFFMTDSWLTARDHSGPRGDDAIMGYYSKDTIIINYNCYCALPGGNYSYTIGVKY